MRVVGLVPLPPYETFSESSKITFSPNTVMYMEPEHKRIGILISAQPTADRESIEVTVELDEGIEIPLFWSRVGDS